MSARTWSQVDRYLESLLLPQDRALQSALRASASAGLPSIQVSPLQGRFLHLLARIRDARRILEVGTLGGYSTSWLARALPPGGRMITLELDPRHAIVARANLLRAGLAKKVEVRVGPALEALPRLKAEGEGPFDLIFLDADKPNNPAYLDWAVRLARPGTVIVVDNVVRDGQVVQTRSRDPRVQGIRRMNARLANDPRLLATTLQTVGRKGYDGFALAVVLRVSAQRRGPRGAGARRFPVRGRLRGSAVGAGPTPSVERPRREPSETPGSMGARSPASKVRTPPRRSARR
ncbi:MAG TPA: O-methyltransferase [Thermoplasmata archaeon]|nr:O-methyltransferase [Thermoplasmata archaeon]